MNFNPYIYNLYYQSNLLNYLTPNRGSDPYKINISFVTEVLAQPESKTLEHNIVAIRE